MSRTRKNQCRYELHYFEWDYNSRCIMAKTMQFVTLSEASDYLTIAGKKAYIIDLANQKTIRENK